MLKKLIRIFQLMLQAEREFPGDGEELFAYTIKKSTEEQR